MNFARILFSFLKSYFHNLFGFLMRLTRFQLMHGAHVNLLDYSKNSKVNILFKGISLFFINNYGLNLMLLKFSALALRTHLVPLMLNYVNCQRLNLLKKDNFIFKKNDLQKLNLDGRKRIVVNDNFQKIYENRTVHQGAVKNFNFIQLKNATVDSILVEGYPSVSRHLTNDSKLNVNFQALEDFKNYLLLLGDTFVGQSQDIVRVSPKVTRKEKILKKEDSFKLNKKFKRRSNFFVGPVMRINATQRVSGVTIKHTQNLLNQINFLLANKRSILKGEILLENLDLSKEIKTTLVSYSSSTGPYGPDVTLYSSDLFSTNKLNSIRRVSLSSADSKSSDLHSFKRKVGFLNFNVSSNEEFERTSDLSNGGFFSGSVFSINPFLVIGLIFYSLFEFFVIFYFMSFIFGTPYDTFYFFFKFPLVYYYENLAAFPSANYFFFAMSFWLLIVVMFLNHLFELLDEERYNPPQISWLFNFLKEFVYDFIFLWCLIFCLMETVMFIDLMLTRFFFVGSPGYPQIIVACFLTFYEIFQLLGTVGYFSLYLENFIYFDVKFPIFYFSDLIPLVRNYPLVQSGHLFNSLYYRPNFFIWVLDNLVNSFSETSRSLFFSIDKRFIFQRELIQDIRKYNYVRKYLSDLHLVGQIYLHGWNGFNYRLDLKVINEPIIPGEQIVRFDWRFKNSHFDGLNSRLFRPDLFGSKHFRSFPALKKIKYAKHKYQFVAPRYGYLEYLKAPKTGMFWIDPKKEIGWRDDYQELLLDKAALFAETPNANRQYYRFFLDKSMKLNKKKRDARSSFLFSPAGYKFSKMKELHQIIPTKTRRNYRNSQFLANFWSYFPGTTKPRLPFHYRSFLPLSVFTKMHSQDYFDSRLYLNEDYFRPKSFFKKSVFNAFPIDKRKFRFFYLNDPHIIFPNALLSRRNELLSEHPSRLQRKTHYLKNNEFSKSKFLKKGDFVSSALPSSKLKVSEMSHNIENNKLIQKKIRPSLLRRKTRIAVRDLPNYPYKTSGKKFHSVVWFFLNSKPSYILRPTSVFTTYARLVNFFTFKPQKDFQFFGRSLNLTNDTLNGVAYPVGVFLFGFGKLPVKSVKIVSFDYYYAQNYNFLHSFIDLFFKKDQFLTIPNSVGRFGHFSNGGIRYSLDFMYPMISELRIKEKFIPLNFTYESINVNQFQKIDLDPYVTIRTAKLSKGPCYFLDARIQNWFASHNVLWNDYYHFFFNRSFKTEGNGSKFCLASFNPLNGPLSYKLFLNSPTLELARIGQYFYTYIPWLQYKFQWLLYPTSTYKRFDAFRFVQQHSNKKFYFTSLLKFYQVTLFRWQQAANLFNYNQSFSRNFLIHLFFHKYKIMFDFTKAKEILNNFAFDSLQKKIDEHPLEIIPSVNLFNNLFFSVIKSFSNDESSKGVSSKKYQLFFPFFSSFDFRFFQYSVDFRRWRSLQTNYLRDWKFENYLRYLGPLVYKQDIPSLMGFFAPFEYRNQIFVNKMRMDSLRFSVFFPKKVIVEENPFLSNPRFPRVNKVSYRRTFSNPSFYAFLINKPMYLNGSNYSYFLDNKYLERNKSLFSRLYSQFVSLNLSHKLNLNYGSGFSEQLFSKFSKVFADVFYGFDAFSDFNLKKKRILRDKLFWFSRTDELQKIAKDARAILFEKDGLEGPNISGFSLDKFIMQLGRPLDKIVPLMPSKVEFYTTKPFILKSYFLNFAKFKKHDSMSKPLEIYTYLNPNIYVSFNGPKALSHNWHMGQSWLKFVIASQNAIVQPSGNLEGFGDTAKRKGISLGYPGVSEYATNRFGQFNSAESESNASYKTDNFVDSSKTFSNFSQGNSSFFSSLFSLDGKVFAPKFIIPKKSGYFNFGLSGIGRLPRLSRSFFHMLFSHNKLEEFKKLKIQYLKLFLMSVPLFTETEFSFTSSSRIFWKLLITSHYYSDSQMFRYNVFFNFFSQYKIHPIFYTFSYISNIGMLLDASIIDSSSIILVNQYDCLKSYNRFLFFSQKIERNFASSSPLCLPEKILSDTSKGDFFFLDKLFSSLFFKFYDLKHNLNFFSDLSFETVWLIMRKIFLDGDFFFYFYNFFSKNSNILFSKMRGTLLFFDGKDKNNLNLDFLQSYKLFDSKKHFLNMSFPFFSRVSKNDMHDLFRLRFYYGSFRSQLNWFVYPVHFYFSMRYSITKVLSIFIFDSVNFSLNASLKYNTFLRSSFFNSFGLVHFWSYILKFPSSNNFYNKYSLHFDSFSYCIRHIFLFSRFDFFCFDVFAEKLFLINLFYRWSNFESLNSLFLFRDFFPEITVFHKFFFSLNFLNAVSSFDLFYNYELNAVSSNFVSGSEFFANKLYDNGRSVDGSGRYVRPKGLNWTMNRIFTYREFEKYRKEHHRQRFRAISPYWIQNSLKNRYNFASYFGAPERRYKLSVKRKNELRRVVSSLDRTRVAPSFKGRVTALNYLNDKEVLDQLLKQKTGLSSLNFSKGETFFVDINEKPSGLNFDKPIQNLFYKKQILFFINNQVNFNKLLKFKHREYLTLKKAGNFFSFRKATNDEPISNKLLDNLPFFQIDSKEAFAFDTFSIFSNENLNSQDYISEFDINEIKFGSKKNTDKQENKLPVRFSYPILRYLQDPSFFQKEEHLKKLFVWETSSVNNFFQKANPIKLNSFSKDVLNFTVENSLNSVDGLNSLQIDYFLRNSPVLFSLSPTPYLNVVGLPSLFNKASSSYAFSKTFPLTSDYFLKKSRHGVTQLPRVRAKWQSVAVSGDRSDFSSLVDSFFVVPFKKEMDLENNRRVRPRFYKTMLDRSFGSTQLGIGASFYTNKNAYYKYSAFEKGSSRKTDSKNFYSMSSAEPFSEESQDIISKKMKPDKFSGYVPANVRRFIRPYNKVLMYMPFLYSKWYTQNPRLSLSVNNKFLSLFVNNDYDEFNYICVQSLFLLKRKIMYNVVNLKLFSYKTKLLYFSKFYSPNNTKFTTVHEFSFVDTLLISAKHLFFKIYTVVLNSNFFNSYNILSILHEYYLFFSDLFFSSKLNYIRLLDNKSISHFKHNSTSFDDFYFFNYFYNDYVAKRVISQISISNTSLQGWNNPIGLFGQYMPGLNFYFGSSFNFSYQYPDFFSGRSFSPEMFLLNNLYRQNNRFFARDLFFGEYPVDLAYRPSWHFLTFRIASPMSPFVEYELPYYSMFSKPIKQRQWKLPMLSLRRFYDIYPKHASSFFSFFGNQFSTTFGYDGTLPLKLKFLNFNFRKDSIYRRQLENSFISNSKNLFSYFELFPVSLNLKQLGVLSEFNNKVNFSRLVNHRRFSLRINQWSPIRFNFYYLFNWKSFVHRFSSVDQIGRRSYKVNPFFDLFFGSSFSLKSKGLQHLIVSQIPRAELDSRRRVPVSLSLKDFGLLIFHYFNYVNQNFYDEGYSLKEEKIRKYVNRKIHPFLSFLLPAKNEKFQLFRDIGFISNNNNNKSTYFVERKIKWPIFSIEKLSKTSRSSVSSNYERINNFIKNQPKDVPSKKRVVFFSKFPEKLFNVSKACFAFMPKFFNFSGYKGFAFSSLFSKKLYLKRVLQVALGKIANYWLLNRPFKNGVFPNFAPWFFVTKTSSSRIKHGLHLEAKARYSSQLLKQLYHHKRAISRILGIYELFKFKQRKERQLNPAAWLSFDLFSRVRPSFRPFLTKFGKTFLLSKIVPVKGFPSYNFQIKSHTRYDNFFERHPYIAFGIGSFSNNTLLFSEGAYKEIRKRSFMLDFSKRLPFRDSPNYSFNPRFRSNSFYNFSNTYGRYNNFEKYPFFTSLPLGSTGISFSYGSPSSSIYSNSRLVTPKFEKIVEEESKFFNRSSTFNTALGSHVFPAESATLLEQDDEDSEGRTGLFLYPAMESFFSGRQNFSYRFNNFYKNSIHTSFTSSINRRALLFNTQLLRPHVNFLKIIRRDVQNFSRSNFFVKSFSFVNDLLNFQRNSFFRSFYQPNLKVFFDFNAYKQRYNLSLLFRELSFDEDFQFFLFCKRSFLLDSFGFQYFISDLNFMSSFTILQPIDYFRFSSNINVKNSSESVFFNDYEFFSEIERFILKFDIIYGVLTIFDFVVAFFFTFMVLIKHLNVFDFSFFLNFFDFRSDNFYVYNPHRSTFQLFFHLSILREYIKFSWLFSLKFLIFNFDYYPYYFLLFWFLLVSRSISLRIRRSTYSSPFLVPYFNKFSDLKINSYNGWFETAWKEIQSESVERLSNPLYEKSVKLAYTYPVSLNDIDILKKSYKISKKQNLNDAEGFLIDDKKILGNKKMPFIPLSFVKLKNFIGKINLVSFIFPYFQSRRSGEFAQEDSFGNLSTTTQYDGINQKIMGLPQAKEQLLRYLPRSYAFSFKIFFEAFFLFLKRQITFIDFLRIFNLGSFASSYLTQYSTDDFNNDFDNLFSVSNSHFNYLLTQNIKHCKMNPEDENIHFYKKPSPFDLETMSSNNLGTESDQFYYILEFPGKYNNSHLNTFSKMYSVRQLNYNYPQFGFLSFAKNSKLPVTFGEFLNFCSLNPSNFMQNTENPVFSKQLSKYYNLWSLFQHVIRYDYNMFSYYNIEDIRLKRSRLLLNLLEDRSNLVENFKFWASRASTDALEFNIFNPYLFVPSTYNTVNFEENFFSIFSSKDAVGSPLSTSMLDKTLKLKARSPYDGFDYFPYTSESRREDRFTKFSFSFLYIFYTYLFLFVYFLCLIIFFCLVFLLLFSIFNYLVYWV